MKARFAITAALASVLALSACGDDKGGATDTAKSDKALEKVTAPTGADWTQTVTKTADGGYLMGNPNAPIKLVEYAAVTCSHCAEFEEAAYGELFSDFVASGRVNFEVRNFLLNPYDIPISVLTRCGEPSTYFPLTQQFFENQRAQLERAQQAPQEVLQSTFGKQDYYGAAQAMGVLDFFKARGISEDQAKACLADQGRVKELLNMTEKASKELEVRGTPSFFINGAAYDFQGWPAMKQKLMDMGAR